VEDQPPEGGQTGAVLLPEPVRQRVVTLASRVLDQMTLDQVPGPLRPFARFAPARRVKLAAVPIAAALETDATFRARVADGLRAISPDLAEALFAGVVPAAVDPHDIAAAAYVLRPPNWRALLTTTAEAAEQADRAAGEAKLERELGRLRDELTAARAQAQQEAARLAADAEEARRDAESLRRKVRRAEADMKRAEASTRTLAAEVTDLRAELAATAASGDVELRRLRGRLAESEAALDATRRAARADRNIADVRLRLLLDTLVDAATGLRRELAVPPAEHLPADTVGGVAPDAPTPDALSERARGADDPSLLDEYLRLPRVHLVVDGYNVTKTGYPSLTLQEQRLRLLGGLAVLGAQTHSEVTCVFDGAELNGAPPVAAPRGVRVLFSRPGQTADDLIRDLVAAEPRGRPLVVVSSDREVADSVRRSGARPVPSTMLLRRLGRS
jgi:predicted RNA-binding protein with PIN domain